MKKFLVLILLPILVFAQISTVPGGGGGGPSAVSQSDAFNIINQVPVAAAGSGRATVPTPVTIDPISGNLITPGTLAVRDTSSNTHSVVPATLTANRTITLPNFNIVFAATSTANATVVANASGKIDNGFITFPTEQTSRVFAWDVPGSPAVGDLIRFPVPCAFTISKVFGSMAGGTSVSFNAEERVSTTPYTAGVDVLSAELVGDAAQSSCASGCDVNTISNASLDAGDYLAITVSAVSGAVTNFLGYVEGACN